MRIEDRYLSSHASSRAIRWSPTDDPTHPYRARIGTGAWTIRVNDFPDEHLFTLLIDGSEVGSFDEWPTRWVRPNSTKISPADSIEALSAREYQVFALLVEGIRTKEIAARLELSPKTVDTYRASLMRKLDVRDVAGLVKFATQRDIKSSR